MFSHSLKTQSLSLYLQRFVFRFLIFMACLGFYKTCPRCQLVLSPQSCESSSLLLSPIYRLSSTWMKQPAQLSHHWCVAKTQLQPRTTDTKSGIFHQRIRGGFIITLLKATDHLEQASCNPNLFGRYLLTLKMFPI